MTATSPAIATSSRPSASEYAPYYDKYVQRVPDGDIVAVLRNQIAETAALLRTAPADRADGAYAPGKWTLKEVVGHMVDVERVMSIARSDSRAAMQPIYQASTRTRSSPTRTSAGGRCRIWSTSSRRCESRPCISPSTSMPMR
jgi:hypothetical protein